MNLGRKSSGRSRQFNRGVRSGLYRVAGAGLLLAALSGGSPLLAALKEQVICTEAEPANQPTHFRFENGGTQPEILLDLDYAKGSGGRWQVGRTYVLSIDDNADRAIPVADAMFTSRTECTSVSKTAFRLTAADPAVTIACSLSWEVDPAPVTSPWSKAGLYSVQILDLPAAGPTGSANLAP